ncbi:MAG: glutamate--tRNA ligase [bacterium]|nr:glutamate--tRNA ligase [bacterium]
MPKNIRLRFAPSPTGWLHIGSLRTVLFNYLITKSLGGALILRIEDTDQKREVAGAVEKLIDILDWLGIKFDEGPHIAGEFGPYTQSQRLEIYKKYSDELLAAGKAYRCFCAGERLDDMRQRQQAQKLPPRYDRTCRDLPETEIERKLDAGEKFVIRQKMPLEGEIIVHDELRGQIKFMAADLDDQVLIKSNGIPTYQFASVVDDHLMQISHVLRGDEWLSSFPKNILLYQAFGWEPPKFIHLPLILNKGGGKLSKRQGDVAVEDFRAKGYLPEALLNFVALQGWHPKDDQEVMTMEEMIEKFRIENLGISPAVFDIEKLDYFNGWYIRHKTVEELTKLCLPFLAEAGIIEEFSIFNFQFSMKFKNKKTGKEINFEYIKKVIALEQERLKKLSDIGEATRFFFEDKFEYEPELLIWKKMDMAQVKNNLEEIHRALEKIPAGSWTNDSIEDALMAHIQARGGKVGEYLWPMRAALTGRQASPGPFDVAEVLGKEGSLNRVRLAADKLE